MAGEKIIEVLIGDALTKLKELPNESVQCVVTSPPYWGLRDYGVDGQLGLEKTPEEYVRHLVEVFRELKRVLRDDGTVWLNLGDSYASDSKGTGGPSEKQLSNAGSRYDAIHLQHGLKSKDLVGIPWRVAFALQADGWYLRSDIIWSKPNPMPESVTDRPTKSHEYIFLLTKSPRYFYDQEAIREPHETPLHSPGNLINTGVGERARTHPANEPDRQWGTSSGRNKRSVWTMNTKPYAEAHFATFPPELPETCIKAGTSQKGCCPKCGAPWERVVKRDSHCGVERGTQPSQFRANLKPPQQSSVSVSVKTIGWQPTCECGEATTVPCVVMDPFAGSGTTGEVARNLGRRAVLIELNPEYLKLINARTMAQVQDITGCMGR